MYVISLILTNQILCDMSKIVKVKKSEKTSFECSKCSKIFQYKCHLKAHLKNHTDMKICEVCNQEVQKA